MIELKTKKPEDFENEILEEINSSLDSEAQMSYSERQFLNGIIRQCKPKKILEVGVYAGGSSAIILNAIKDFKDTKLYSIDRIENYGFNGERRNIGNILDSFPELTSKWTLYKGGIACNFLDEIGGDIDICLLDTMHCNPGEFMDYLQIIPYMKKNGIIIIHDIAMHALGSPLHTTCGTLFSVIKGEKILPARTEAYNNLPNIGAVVLDDNPMDRAFDVFNCLSLPWAYNISDNDVQLLIKHFSKHYDSNLIELFKNIVTNSRNAFNNSVKAGNQPKISY